MDVSHKPSDIEYLSGFGNHLQSEAIDGTLPHGQNSPQHTPKHLYAEQINGSSFTSAHSQNRRSWLYRIRPSVLHDEFKTYKQKNLCMPNEKNEFPPNQLRWDPMPYPNKPKDFIDGLITFATNGSPALHTGGAIYLYAINQSMEERFFYNADGELLIVPQEGSLLLRTEFGYLQIRPGEIAVIPRGVKFHVELFQEQARGYVCENYGNCFTLPERGPIGANGLANERDFQIPIAHFEKFEATVQLFAKFQGKLWVTKMAHSPLDVVAWHGNYVPYKYDLKRFNTLGSISFDHPDPSIYTVLTSPSSLPGVANIDFVIFPDRWMVSEHTFRPPYYHRNVMSEFMGQIYGTYDAKVQGFPPGASSLHNCMSAHGPDANAYSLGTQGELKPEHYQNTLAIMFESQYAWQPSEFALTAKFRQKNYLDCWKGLKARFNSDN